MFSIAKEGKEIKIPRTIRFTDKIFEDLNRLAVENDISFNQLVMQCCAYALRNLNS